MNLQNGYVPAPAIRGQRYVSPDYGYQQQYPQIDNQQQYQYQNYMGNMNNIGNTNNMNNMSANSIIWVNSREEADMCPVNSANVFIPFFDAKVQRIYIRHLDAMGRPQTRVLEYHDVDQSAENDPSKTQDTAEYATQEQMAQLTAQISEMESQFQTRMDDLQKKLNDFKSKVMNTNNKRDKS